MENFRRAVGCCAPPRLVLLLVGVICSYHNSTRQCNDKVIGCLMLPLAYFCFMCFQAQPEVEVVLGPQCITEMHATKDTDCRGPDLSHLTCKRIVITYKPSCEHINVVPK